MAALAPLLSGVVAPPWAPPIRVRVGERLAHPEALAPGVRRYVRYLAKPGESYIALCRRLFGEVIEPNAVILEDESSLQELMTIFMMLRDVPKPAIERKNATAASALAA